MVVNVSLKCIRTCMCDIVCRFFVELTSSRHRMMCDWQIADSETGRIAATLLLNLDPRVVALRCGASNVEHACRSRNVAQ